MSYFLAHPFSAADDIFKQLNQSLTKQFSDSWMPAVDIEESDHFFAIKAELPGVKKEDVNISIDNDVLTVQGEKRSESKDRKRHREECFYGSFSRSFSLPQGVDTSEVEAHYDDGVLNLTLPKVKEVEQKKTQIKIK